MGGDLLLALLVAVPLAGAVAIGIAGRWPNVREAVTLLTAGTLAALAWSFVPAVIAGGRPELVLASFLPGVDLLLRVEPLGMLFACLASSLWIVNSIYSIGYMRGMGEQNQTRFYACFALAIAATMGVATAGNLLTLFLFYEALTLSTYPLVAHAGDRATVASARVYLGILLGTSIGLFLPAILWTFHVAGTLDFAPGGILGGRLSGPDVGLLLGMFLFGIGKAAIMPVHRWLPAAMVAPTPVSALLHAVAVVKTGVFVFVKVVVLVFGPELLAAEPSAAWLRWVAAFTVLGASVVALRQDSFKRMLAYSTISQLGYVVLAAAVLKPLAEVGASVHIVAHAFGKITLFFTAGAVYVASGKTALSQLDGIGRRMPWTATAFTVAALSMVGVPPTAGFVSKWYILAGCFQTDDYLAITTLVLSTALNAAYFLPVVHRMWFRSETVAPPTPHGEAPWPAVLALVVTAMATLAFFFLNAPVVALEMQFVEGMR